MMQIELNEEQIYANWMTFQKFCQNISDESRRDKILKMLESIGDELVITPASAKRDFHNAFAGGLVDHSLRVLRNAVKYSKAMNLNIERDSVIIAALFHDLGKIGDGTQPYYVKQTDKWREEKLGEVYTHNHKLTHMSVGLRSLYVLSSHNVILTQPEWLAIYLNDGWVLQENKPYCLKEPALVHVIQTADYFSTLQEKRGDDITMICE